MKLACGDETLFFCFGCLFYMPICPCKSCRLFEDLSILAFLNASKYCGSVLKNDVVVVVVGVLTNFYHIFKESDHFESLVETCPKRKIVCGCCIKIYYENVNIFFKIHKKYIDFYVKFFYAATTNNFPFWTSFDKTYEMIRFFENMIKVR